MKKIMYITILTTLSFGVLFSCKKDSHEHEEELNSAVISFTQPLMGDHIHHMDTLKVRGTIVSVQDMHGYNVRICRNTADTATVFYYNDHYHGMNKNLDVNWACDLNENVELKVTVTAILDHDGNKTSASTYVQCEP